VISRYLVLASLVSDRSLFLSACNPELKMKRDAFCFPVFPVVISRGRSSEL